MHDSTEGVNRYECSALNFAEAGSRVGYVPTAAGGVAAGRPRGGARAVT